MTNKTKELVAAGYALAKDLHCAESAALVRELATQLDVQLSRSNALAAENAGLKAEVPMGSIVNGRAFADRLEAYPFECQGGNLNMCSDWQELLRCFEHLSEWAMHGQPETPSTDAFLAEVRASAIPEGYVLVPQEMHLSSEAMEGICFHCGDGDHNFGEFTDGTLFVGDVDYGDGKKVHGLHIATADYPEEGCATICEFAAQLRKGVQS
ncbi:hypothetical protein ACOT1L_12910 [Enterobacter cloacae complex sp. XJL004]|uniref:hypothetical protein n=1 Tax=Enterobacter cloacae complex TaxID=354276 RepID=UPI00097C392C|nr:hypothetical protein [Enterobacter chengduensis]GJL40683.1 hypothetical protein TUM17577_18920 [Enterobacter asburiae]HCD3310201.1 hypothetical protein [Enterobacter chengduensis]HCH6696679.1 hypothetical protein [Enterobacter chengduensis]HDT4527953.1 hypothetical protein [Enterobacter chengduensis]